jgi:hypothetical protein
MERMFIVHVVATDEYGTETKSTIPVKLTEDAVQKEIEEDLDEQYPHLKHRVTEINELKTPGEVENWHNSYLGAILGPEDNPDDPNKND